jgi:D-proline reductase (dithiol) PrdB
MRAEDVTQHVLDIPTTAFDPTPAVTGKPLSERRIAIVSTAGLMHRGEEPFSIFSTDYRILDTESDKDVLMSHVSTNFDRTGFTQDHNLVYPIDRLHEKRDRGEIGSVARYHYSFMGAIPPENVETAAQQLAKTLRGDEVDGLILVPV